MPLPAESPGNWFLSDPAMVKAIQAGDVAAFEQVFKTHYDALWRFANHYVRSSAVAEDIVQDIFSAVWAHRDSWEPREGIKSYLFKAVRNRTINHYRRSKFETQVLDIELARRGNLSARVPSPGDGLDDDYLKRLLDSLPEPRRTAVILRYYGGAQFSEIAAIIGTTTRAAEMLVSRAIRSLQKKIQENL